MSRTTSSLDTVAFVGGLLVTLIGLANVMPSYGFLPRLGPFGVEWFRPVFYWLSMLTVISTLLVWSSKKQNQAKWLFRLDVCLFALCAGLLTYFCYDYYEVGLVLQNSVMFFSAREAMIATFVAAISIYLCWRTWGAAIAILGIIAFAYIATGQYWPSFLATAPHDVSETIAQNIWYASDQGILGNILGIVLSTVLPFIILGALLDGCGAGKSMIRISFRLMHAFKGGPAYAAIFASALFGTVSGSAVANVVGTGVVTIPMIRRRGFSANFAGAVESAASTGGQILPPIMGAAALVMADLVGVSYLTVITAALIPGLAYYASLFLAVYFRSGQLNLEVSKDLEKDLEVTSQDFINLGLVFGPIAVIVWMLVAGASPAGASITALFLLIPASLVNPAVRQKPMILLESIADGGRTVAQLAVAIAIVGIVVSTLSATGIPTKFAILLSAASESSLFLSLLITALGCVVLGMGMPTLPAYIAIVVVMGPTLQGFGLSLLTVHFFVFFFGVASAITPPVAIASYAAAAIAGGRPVATSVISSKIGAMIFLIPFAFAFHPTLLIVPEAAGDYTLATFAMSLVCLLLSLYLCSSALIGHDRSDLNLAERGSRLAATALLLSPGLTLNLTGLAIGSIAIIAHFFKQPALTNEAN